MTGYTKITETSHNVTVSSTNTNYGGVTNGSQIVSNNGNATITISPKSGYEYSSNTCSGTVSGNILTIKDITSNKTCTVTFIEDYQVLAFKERLVKDNPTVLTRTSFDSAFMEENTRTLYKATGNETEDGSVRLLYVGTNPTTTTAFIKIDGSLMGIDSTAKYSSSTNYLMYVGYMYGTKETLENNRLNSNSSTIKKSTDLWYSKTLNVKTDEKGNTYDKYVSRTAIYCNDRSGDEYSTSAKTMYFATYKRLEDSKSPSYKCGNNASKSLFEEADVADKFSVSTTKGGNGKLMYPIAQITADEIIYAGGYKFKNSATWYYYNSNSVSVTGDNSWWTMSPYGYYNYKLNVYKVSGYDSNYSGQLGYFTVKGENIGIRPVLSLKSCVKVTSGNGSSTTPYEVTIDSTCASAEN